MLETTTRRVVPRSPSRPGLDARERREVAGHEREHARRDDRREAGHERDGEARAHQSRRASRSSSSRSVSSSSPDGTGAGSGSRERLQRHTPKPRIAAPPRTPPSGSHHASRSNPLCGGAARMPAPKFATSSSSIWLGRPALRDPAADLRLDRAGGGRVRLVERRVAGRAHHLALEIRERGLRMGARRGRRPGERERGDRDGEDAERHEPSAVLSAARKRAARRRVGDRPGDVQDDLPVAPDDVRLRHRGDPVAARRHVARAVLHHREAQLVRGDEAAAVARDVVVVDADEDDAAAAVLQPRLLELRRLGLAGDAPGGPEVQHDGLPAQRREVDAAAAREPAQREPGRGGADLRRVLLVGQAPEQQHEQRRRRTRPRPPGRRSSASASRADRRLEVPPERVAEGLLVDRAEHARPDEPSLRVDRRRSRGGSRRRSGCPRRVRASPRGPGT